jgi:hypothetical protein
MVFLAPFGVLRHLRGLYALMFSYGQFHVPQNLSGQFARRRSQSVDHIRRVEVDDDLKIPVLKLAFHIQAAAGHNGVGD